MSPVFIYIGGEVVPPVGGWLIDYDGTLNGDTVEIVVAADPPVRRDDNDRVDVFFFDNQAIAKVGNFLVFIDSNLNVTDFVDIQADIFTLPSPSMEVHRVSIIKKDNSFFIIAAIDPDNGAFRRVEEFRWAEFTHVPGFGITVLNLDVLVTNAVSNILTDVDINEMQTVLIDSTGTGTVFIRGTGFSMGILGIIDDFFSSNPTFSPGNQNRPLDIPLTIFPGPDRGHLRFFPAVTADKMVVGASGSEGGLSPNFQDRIIVWVAERVGNNMPAVDDAEWLDLTSQLLLGTADPDGVDGGKLLPEFKKIGVNLFVAINRKAAVLFEMDEIVGDGTVLDTLDFSATIFNSGAQMQNINITRPQVAAFPSGSPVDTAEIIANFDKLNDTGDIAFRYFNVVVRVNLLTNTFDPFVNGPIQTDQNVSAGPGFVDEWFGDVDSDEIWNLWGAQSGSDMLLRGMKIKR